MSYSIEIEKDADGIRIKSTSGLQNVPDGLLTVNGHTPGLGTSPVATLSVNLAGPIGPNGVRQFVASAVANYLAPVVAPETAGERAYAGYFQACDGKSLISGADLPSWGEQAPEIRAAWVAAAAAVR